MTGFRGACSRFHWGDDEALIQATIGPIHGGLVIHVGGIENAPPPPASTSGTHTEIAGRSSGAPANGNAAGKKPWSKPAITLIDDGVLLTETGMWTDPNNNVENQFYTMTS